MESVGVAFRRLVCVCVDKYGVMSGSFEVVRGNLEADILRSKQTSMVPFDLSGCHDMQDDNSIYFSYETSIV